MLQEFITYLKSHVNKSIYVWGSQGKKFKSFDEAYAYIDRYETTETNKKRARKLLDKLKAAGVPIEEIRAFDCSGLGMYWLENVKGIYGYDMSANSMYGKCVALSKSELKKGDWVFKYSTTQRKIVHIGYVVDVVNGVPIVIESKGRDDGVVMRPLSSGSWNRFGRPKVFKDEIENGEEDIMINGNSDIKVIKAWQENLDKAGFRNDMNPDKYGSWGVKTEAATKAFQKSVGLTETGVVDTWTLLKMVDARASKAPVVVTPPTPTYPKYSYGGGSYTYFRSKPSTISGKKIDKIYNGEIVEKIGEKGSWWNVKFGGKTGWCANTKLFKKV